MCFLLHTRARAHRFILNYILFSYNTYHRAKLYFIRLKKENIFVIQTI